MINNDEYAAVLAQLSLRYAADLPIDLERLRLVAMTENWQAGAAAMTLSRKWSWANAAPECLQLLEEALTRNAGNPVPIALWLQMAAAGIVGLDGDQETNQRNLAVILTLVLRIETLSPACISAAVSGAKAGAPAQFPPAWISALRDVHRGLLAAGNTWHTASTHIQHLTSSVPDDDRMATVATVIRRQP